MAYKSVEEFGQAIIKKYPHMTGQDPTTIGEKMLKVYPQYENDIEGRGAVATPKAAPSGGSSWMDLPGNIIPSAVNVAKDIGSAIAHPIETVKNAGKIVLGGAAKFVPGEQGYEKNFDAVTEFFVDRYGSLDAAKKTLVEDPVGAALDIATLFTGGGAAASKLGMITKSSKLAKAGEVASMVGNAVDPLKQAGNLAGAGLDAAGLKPGLFNKGANQEIIDLAKKEGIYDDMPVSALSKSTVVQGVEGLEARAGFWGSKIVDKYNKSNENIQKMADTVLSEIENKKTIDRMDLGNTVKKSFDDMNTEFQTTSDALYEKIPASIYKNPAQATKTLETLKKFIDEGSKSLAPDANTKVFQNMLKGFSDKKGNPKPLTIQTLKATLKDIGKQTSSSDPIVRASVSEYRKLYGAITDDMNAAIELADPQVAADLMSAKAFYSEGIERIRSAVGKNIENVNAEKIYDKFVKPNNATDLGTVKELIGDDAFKEVGGLFMGEQVSNSFKNGIFDPTTFIKNMEKFEPSTLNTLLGPGGTANLKDVLSKMTDIKKLSDSLKKGRAISEGSQTAVLSKIGYYTGGGGLMAALTSVSGMVSFVGGLLLGDYALAKFLSSPTGKKFLTEGVQITGGGVRKAGDKTSQYGKPLRAVEATQEPLMEQEQQQQVEEAINEE